MDGNFPAHFASNVSSGQAISLTVGVSNRAQIGGHGRAILPAAEAHRLPDQMHDAGLNHRSGEGRSDRLGEGRSLKRLFLMSFAATQVGQKLHHNEGTFGGQITQLLETFWAILQVRSSLCYFFVFEI